MEEGGGGVMQPDDDDEMDEVNKSADGTSVNGAEAEIWLRSGTGA